MALTKFRGRDWIAGFLSSISNGGTYIPAVTLVDSTGNPTAGADVNIVAVGSTTIGAEVPIADGMGTDVTGTLTTGTSVVASTGIDGFSTVTFSLQGTYANLNVVFEQSDDSGTSWYPVDASRLGTGLVESNVVNLSSQALIWRATVSGCDSFRVRATALTSGTVNVLISITALPTSAGVGIVANFADNRPAAGTITILDSVSSTATGQNGAVLVTGTPTAGSAFALALNGYSGFYALVTGTWTGTLTFEKSIDGGTTWSPFSVHIDSTAYTQIAITANCSVRSAGAGATNVRLRATAAMTGTANVQFVFASADTVTTLTNAARLFDNISGATMAIKAASTAPAATDPAIVVALSPNGQGPYPTGRTALIAGSGNKANASAAATLTPGSTVAAYLAGFEITATGATLGLPVIVTVAGILGGTLSYIFSAPAGVLVDATPLVVEFDPPLPASAVNTPIVVTLPALGTGNTNAAVVAHGYSA